MYSFMYLPAWRMSQMGVYGTLSRLHALRKVSFFTLFSFAGSSPLPGLWKCVYYIISAAIFKGLCGGGMNGWIRIGGYGKEWRDKAILFLKTVLSKRYRQ